MGNRLADAEKCGEMFLHDLGVNTIEEARKIDARTILKQALSSKKYNFGTVAGDKLVPDLPTSMLYRNERNQIPLMIGNTTDEFPVYSKATTYEELEEYAKEFFGKNAEGYLSFCKKDGASELSDMIKNGRHNRFAIGNMIWADVNIEHNGPTMYMYEFNAELPGDSAGSFHSSELWFVFESLAKCWRPFQGKHYDIARHICNYWTNFAKNGDPNGLDNDGTPMPHWRPITEGDCKAMYFGDVAAMKEEPRTDFENFLVDHFKESLNSAEGVKYAPQSRSDGSTVYTQ